MKVLLIGMDGAHIDAFNRGWTPFISSLISSGEQLNIKNDLLSRGWLEIATGKHASVTGAMYDKPKVDGTLLWGTEFSINDIPGLNTSVKPIWDALNEKGYSVGVMNLPTTFPAPSVNGFFVSGGGGGAPVTQEATKDLCYPPECLPLLHESGYIVDDRLYQLIVDKKLTSGSEIFSRLAYKNKKRTESFLKLDEKYKVDFGFIVYKTSSVFAETILNTEWLRRKNIKNNPDDDIVDSVRSYYECFDNEIKALHQKYPSSEFIFVSDHGTTLRTHSVNPNIFLQDKGYQVVEVKKAVVKNLVTKLKEIIPFSVKSYLKKTSVMKAKNIGQTNFNVMKTVAFCKTQGDWVHGIYINDRERFGGPVLTADIESIKADIVESFNSNSEVLKHCLRAYTVDSNRDGVGACFPDICIDIPNGYLTTDKVSDFIIEFKPDKSTSALSSITKGDILSLKSHTPLAVINPSKGGNENFKVHNGDLTIVYDYILSRFK
tara:strand:+ start:7584 stop:9050 length:1467 start_codon:yes stop_codon:yes gene_type:complete